MLIASAGVKIMESQLLWEFIAFLKARWSARSRVDQRRRRLRQLVAMVRAVADAAECRAAVRDGSLSAWLHVLRAEALRGQEVLDAVGCAPPPSPTPRGASSRAEKAPTARSLPSPAPPTGRAPRTPGSPRGTCTGA